ncbi:MAG: winged helix-turn-helix domain-containing protein [Candidatus Korarchaeota archaeon]|nr:winged helix-turn-helix domain-containing protein [Candidatus Korarchaeota archaeon]
MDWEIFTLDDDRVRLFGQEIANDLGRRIISSLREYPKSPNDLAKELNQPLTTIVFHVDKLLEAGVIRVVGTMAGRRGRKTLYTLSSSAFLVVPTTRKDKESYLRSVLGRTLPPKEILVKSLVISVLVAIFIVGMPWYLMRPRPAVMPAEERTTTVAVPLYPETPAEAEKGGAPEVEVRRPQGSTEADWMTPLMLALAASILTALLIALLVLRREVLPYSERTP